MQLLLLYEEKDWYSYFIEYLLSIKKKKRVMTSKKQNNLSLWRKGVKFVKKILIPLKEGIIAFCDNNPNIAQIIQLTFVYIFALLDLITSILNYIFALGFVPEMVAPFLPLIKFILLSPFVQIWCSPEKVFLFSYFVVEYMVVKSVFRFSKLVRYNILLIFSLLMLQGLVISYWDLLFNREMATEVAQWAYEESAFYSDDQLAFAFFFSTFIIFFFGYLYLYTVALRGKFATLPGLEWVTDSVCFWLRIKTPTMRFGNGKRKGKE
jgi:hypothetical protein